MKSSKIKIIILSLACVIFVGVVGTLYYASTQVSPEEVRKLALDGIKQTFPKAKVELGELDLSLGTTVNLKLDKLNMETKVRGRNVNLIKVNDLKIKIPVWSIIFGRGTLEVKVDSPVFSYHEFGKTNNWDYAMGDKKSSPKKSTPSKGGTSDSAGTSEVAVPAFISSAKANISFSNVKVDYKLKSGDKGNVDLSKLVIKNLGPSSTSAFEMSSNLSFKDKKGKATSLTTLLIGEFNLKEFMTDQKMSTTLHLKLSDISLPDSKLIVPTIKSDLNVVINKGGIIDGSMTTTFDQRNKITSSFTLKGGTVNLNKIATELYLSDLLKIANDFSIPVKGNNSRVTLSGSVYIDKAGVISPNLGFNISEGLQYTHGPIVVDLSAKGSYRNYKYNFNGAGKLFGGNVDLGIKGKYNLNSKFDVKTLPAYTVNVAVANFSVPRKTLQQTFYPKDKKKEKAKVEDTKGSENTEAALASPPPYLPKGVVNLNWKNIKIDNQDFNGVGQVITSKHKVILKNLDFNYSKGQGDVTSTLVLGKGTTKSSFDMKLTELNLDAFRGFLPEKAIEKLSGVTSGKVKGVAQTFHNAPAKYNIAVDVHAKDGEIDGINLGSYLEDVVKKIPKVKDKVKNLKQDGSFSSLVFKGNLKESHYNFKKIDFLSKNKSMMIKGNGNLYPTNLSKEGAIFVDVRHKSIAEHLKKYASKETVPMKVKGPGFALKADYKYTLKKLTKDATKAQTKKFKKKGKDKLKKLLKDKKLQDKAKDMFKSFF